MRLDWFWFLSPGHITPQFPSPDDTTRTRTTKTAKRIITTHTHTHYPNSKRMIFVMDIFTAHGLRIWITMDYNGYGNTGIMKKCIMSITVITITMITYLRPSVFKVSHPGWTKIIFITTCWKPNDWFLDRFTTAYFPLFYLLFISFSLLYILSVLASIVFMDGSQYYGWYWRLACIKDFMVLWLIEWLVLIGCVWM